MGLPHRFEPFLHIVYLSCYDIIWWRMLQILATLSCSVWASHQFWLSLLCPWVHRVIQHRPSNAQCVTYLLDGPPYYGPESRVILENSNPIMALMWVLMKKKTEPNLSTLQVSNFGVLTKRNRIQAVSSHALTSEISNLDVDGGHLSKKVTGVWGLEMKKPTHPPIVFSSYVQYPYLHFFLGL